MDNFTKDCLKAVDECNSNKHLINEDDDLDLSKVSGKMKELGFVKGSEKYLALIHYLEQCFVDNYEDTALDYYHEAALKEKLS